jgi:hypothetical protein
MCQCSGGTHIFMYKKEHSSASDANANASSSSSAPSTSTSTILNPTSSSSAEFPSALPTTTSERRYNDKGHAFCLYPGCSKIQQAETCSHGMCVDHCSGTCVKNYYELGTDLHFCRSSGHRDAAKRKAADSPPSTSPRRTRSGATTITRPPAAQTAISAPLVTTTRPLPPQDAGRTNLAQPMALSLDSNGGNIYENTAPTGKVLRELEAQQRSRAQQDSRTYEDSFTVWYWIRAVCFFFISIQSHLTMFTFRNLALV